MDNVCLYDFLLRCQGRDPEKEAEVEREWIDRNNDWNDEADMY